ncbi:hypothetical protein CPC735_053730 [Coccidioides posadasii C735 delta SOWgp]|uniref:Transcription factor TFIIIC triple barrel domain-containing protein n=1 Tax=Coccidioides posadasii (strain C735) TaxID=222929 RepID=C5PHK0_COCP7|nr:hypothetical protein CPC735_053730 [Coccidioides posadasii C735 delta SOWgp]EER24003.1 hypothetical protein CPC735_053730 [Coccidioides posadasii C735 delta SOWgp]|eukprot:XP_003066148.1 hypothetical protein CPC735_053730 [Coccidioides posadasii C735 delta SOWgp]
MQSPTGNSKGGSPPVEPESVESDYEYEYDESERETFYINLDLTSCNGPIRPPRQRSAASSNSLVPLVDMTTSQPGSPVPHSSPNQGQSTGIDPDLEMELQNQIQIMELHSPNPIVSYQNQIFSCSWADQIGTDMMFSLPGDEDDTPALRQNRDFDLVSTTRVKILGQKAHLISGSSSSQAQRMRSGGSSTGQAQFLECLMRAKRAKGEEDIVRTTFPQAQKRNQNIEERLQGWARTEGMLAELENVSQQARSGDPEAMKRLGEIYARFDAASRKNVGPETPATNAQSSTPLVQEHLPGDSALT